MFNKTELTEKLTAELRELAKTQGIANADELRKNDLIDQMLQQQSGQSTPEPTTTGNDVAVKSAKPKMVKQQSGEKPLAKKRARISKDDKSNQTAQPER